MKVNLIQMRGRLRPVISHLQVDLCISEMMIMINLRKLMMRKIFSFLKIWMLMMKIRKMRMVKSDLFNLQFIIVMSSEEEENPFDLDNKIDEKEDEKDLDDDLKDQSEDKDEDGISFISDQIFF